MSLELLYNLFLIVAVATGLFGLFSLLFGYFDEGGIICLVCAFCAMCAWSISDAHPEFAITNNIKQEVVQVDAVVVNTNSVTINEVEEAKKISFCTACGNNLSELEVAHFCPVCGHKLQ